MIEKWFDISEINRYSDSVAGPLSRLNGSRLQSGELIRGCLATARLQNPPTAGYSKVTIYQISFEQHPDRLIG